MYINEISDYLKIKSTRESFYITSKKTGEKVLFPCMSPLLVKRELVISNDYNPNFVSDDKLDLLKQSIIDNGFCFGIVVIFDHEQEKFVIIDGFHRSLISSEKYLDFDYVPVVILDHDIIKRMFATVQFNKARGVHQVDLDADVIRKLIEQGLSDEEVSKHLGIDQDTVFRYKQLTGVAELFKNQSYSQSWEIIENE